MHAADVRYHLDCCLHGAFVTTITTSLVCYKCNRQHRWLDIAITNMNTGPEQHACMHMFTDLTVG